MMNIDASEWPSISALLDEAMDLPESLRQAWLDALPEAHRSHRPSLERLLADFAQVETDDFMNALPRVGVASDPGGTEQGERTVGPYRLLRELGRGGMGSVWLAERVDGVLKRQVALKLPHPGLATRTFADRLARERDILASLAHPHIARLYDAGVSEQGQPYIALAYVQGGTLIDDCAQRGLAVRARIELFLQVLSAVQYAHSHLVIHRDIKPSNVLVDEQGQVHLLDFGIAKLLVEGQAEATALTLDAGLALTPDYASPEQIAGAPISIASDIYSLGVLLHELLAGVRPYHLARQARASLERAVLEIELPRPSDVARAAGPSEASKALRGDLDTIILKALKKKPEERYSTVDAFAEDLKRHLDGAAVMARPDAMSYRIGKFVRRHRVGALAAVLVMVALGAGLAGTTWQARVAWTQAQRALAVQEFLVDLFNEADPAKAQGHELTARQMLDRGRRDLGAKLKDQPQLEAELEGVLVDLYIKLGDDKKVLPLAEAQRDRALRLEGPQSLAYGDALFAMARVHAGLAHHQMAYDLYAKSAEVLRRHATERASQILRIEQHEATQLTMLDRTKEAVELQERLLPRLEAHFGGDSWELLQTRAALAGTYSDLGEHEKATQLIEQVMPGLDHSMASHALDAAEVRINLGYTLWNVRQYGAAQALLEKGIAEADRILGPANATSVEAQRTLGLLYGSQGRYDKAAQTFVDSVDRARQLGGEDAAPTRFAESFEVMSLVMTGRGEEARKTALLAVHQLDHVEGITASIARGFDRRLGLALIGAGDMPEAVRVLGDVAAREASAGVTKGGAHGTTMLYLAGARAGQGWHQGAAEAASQAAASFGHGELNVNALAHSNLTEALARARLHQAEAAWALVADAQRWLAKSPQSSPVDALFVDLVKAEILRQGSATSEADRIERAARERLKAVGGVVPPAHLVLVF